MGVAVSRRQVIGSMAAGATVMASGAWFTLRLQPAAAGHQILSRRELEIVEALALTLFPGEVFPLDGADADVPARVDRIVADMMDTPRRMGFRYVLRSIEMGTQASRGVRFSKLGPQARHEVLTAWSGHAVVPRRLGYDAIKTILGMAYFGHPGVLEHIGWRNDCSGGAA